ncbi:DUF998 domain-containing protein [Cellulomonas triticagri]|uniref:DUF998 domain-containing protein n=1 Tax=Cellulomonas triticagri TaxID=2483352 RepID=A0A3M2JD36_9CELL|nr:DUF998 domain-containing protein [Cellulomonas triticagri]RMI08875.1 DUF998 domain-containing protein [Cellulomonas triticagri]
MRRRAVVGAVVAPVAMIGGWTLAAAVQPGGFDAVRGTISELATGAVAHPGVMTAGLLVTGAAHLLTAAGLRGVRPAGRALLALGGAATAAVGLLPVDTLPGPHAVAAGTAFVALAVWPAATARRGRAAVVVGTSAVLLGLLGWFVVELTGDGDLVGLSERVVAGAQSLTPLTLLTLARWQGVGSWTCPPTGS